LFCHRPKAKENGKEGTGERSSEIRGMIAKRRLWMAAGVIAFVALGVPVALYWLWAPHPRIVLPPPGPLPPPDPLGIVIHHSDTPGVMRGRPVGAAILGELHKRRGFAVRYRGRLYHIGYHYVIREDGTIETGRPEHCIGAHSKITAYNHYLGICLVGNFDDRRNPHHFEPSVPSGEQLRSLIWLCARLSEKYHIPTDHIIRHQDIRQTACPGDKFPYHWVLYEVDQYRPVIRARMRLLATNRLPESGRAQRQLSR
jgi:N-acetylmuramoyl-L-alanine amidase-like protein